MGDENIEMRWGALLRAKVKIQAIKHENVSLSLGVSPQYLLVKVKKKEATTKAFFNRNTK